MVVNNAAWGNSGRGFDQALNRGRMTVTRNTAYGNGRGGFWFGTAKATLTGNLARSNRMQQGVGPRGGEAGNSWQLAASTTEPLRTADRARAEGPRPAAGGLPATTFLTGVAGLGSSMTAAR